MKKVVELKKQSKKAQKAHNNAQRGSWGTVNPCHRVFKSEKDYNRSREKQRTREEVDL